MGKLSRILRNSQDNGLLFWCPGCNEPHQIHYGNGGWTWNGDVNKPTFLPSVLVQSGHYCKRENINECWCTYNAAHPEETPDFKCRICHSFITDGNIHFLNDCSHELSGQTLPLPTYPSKYNKSIKNE